jgi:hypothetical protein
MICKVNCRPNGRCECEKSLIGCVRCCDYRPDARAFKMAQLAAKPLHERDLSVTDAVQAPWQDHDTAAKWKAETKKKRRVRNLRPE